jgi:hypothetical protein
MLVTLVYLTKISKEKKQKLKKMKKDKRIMKTNNRWAGWPVFENSLTDRLVDYI